MKASLTEALSEIQIPPDDLEVLVGTGDDQVLYCTLPGAKAITAWEALSPRIDEIGYTPAIVGRPDHIRRIRETYEDAKDRTTPTATLKYSETIDARQWLHKQYELDQEAFDRRFTEDPKPEWPFWRRFKPTKLHSPYHYTGDLLPECVLAFIPITKSWEAPAYLLFGDYNACPSAAVHVAMLRYWSEQYHLRLACISSDVIEVFVDQPPPSKDDAMALAKEQYIYCDDIVDQGVGYISNLAVQLWQSPVWYFWWD